MGTLARNGLINLKYWPHQRQKSIVKKYKANLHPCFKTRKKGNSQI